MLLNTSSYESTIVNHKTARHRLEQFADRQHPARVFWLDGATHMGKTYLLKWFAANIDQCHSKLFCLQDHASVQYLLWDLADVLQDADIATPTFDQATKPQFRPSQAEISDISIQGQNNNVGINIGHSQNGREAFITYREQLKALAKDLKNAGSTSGLPTFVIMFDQMERYDWDTKNFIYKLFTRELYPFPFFQFIFSGNGVVDESLSVPDPKLQRNSLKAVLTQFTRAEDLVRYLEINGTEATKSQNLQELAERTLKQCNGIPYLVAIVLSVLCKDDPE